MIGIASHRSPLGVVLHLLQAFEREIELCQRALKPGGMGAGRMQRRAQERQDDYRSRMTGAAMPSALTRT